MADGPGQFEDPPQFEQEGGYEEAAAGGYEEVPAEYTEQEGAYEEAAAPAEYEEGERGMTDAAAAPDGEAPKQAVDENGGFYDEQGLYHDGMGGVYDADGNYYYDETQAGGAAEGQYYDEENPDIPDATYNKEDAGCCKSFMTSVYPLMITIIVLNAIMIIMGGVILGVGVYILEGGEVQLSGFSNIEGVVTSSPYVFSIICIVLGSIIIFFATLGIAISKFMATGGMFGFIRCMYFIYQSFMILVLLILAAVCILSGVGLGLIRGDNGFSADGWGDNVVLDPRFSCQQQYDFLCAGYLDGNCDSDNPDINADCPGHRCVDFCRVEEDVPNDTNDCKACINQAENGWDFPQCKDFETRFAFNGCQQEINNSLSDTYILVIIVTTISAFFVILVIAAGSWKSCACCQ
uniref:Uncharacterized protein n=1 Tax=Timspurckia oligopyrenoides TaxID=708627 RepID=A0A7S0ZHV8_9RHOD|mmetsp:Transcript_5723/g.10101  ORF Transcript_5723/g.10101 Transcript_5723/m.10101 type:complete len:406 (+) Transcript_5723:101-1318(+)|eukprot:CAMPEP_0182446768 /NCGR_PEP_ID=MMETSP1172-20130603/5983_1 /TAXON_ID=708627 /ORGANISM="Timspurckia oligopyrenoides, Strain CCMP3278" /LENGTH=405 /DNA_ID=CAMNT_0024642833 /DNA_START=45 /DNA_END=1262 /DNA_ORIENTATION=-